MNRQTPNSGSVAPSALVSGLLKGELLALSRAIIAVENGMEGGNSCRNPITLGKSNRHRNYWAARSRQVDFDRRAYQRLRLNASLVCEQALSGEI